jgi:hypothetical protein
MTDVAELVDRALEEWRDDRLRTALLELQGRPTREALNAGLAQLGSEDADRRRLGCLILRELRDGADPVTQAPRPCWETTAPAVARLAQSDVDPLVRADAVVALGYIAAPGTFELVIDLVDDKDAGVRDALCRTLACCQSDGDILSDTIVEPLVSLAADADAEVRWSATWELAGFGPNTDAVRAVLERARDDPDPRMRECAEEGFERLNAL